MKKEMPVRFAVWWIVWIALLSGCVAREGAIRVENRLPDDRLAFFSDSFDAMRPDLWEPAGMVHSEAQLENYKPAHLHIRDGKMVVTTETGCFSKGGLGSTFRLQGDFDIQIDCRMDLMEGGTEVDRIAVFGVYEEGRGLDEMNGVHVGLSRKELQPKGYLFSNYLSGGKVHRGSFTEKGSFDGTLRLVRRGIRVTALYRERGDSGWSNLGVHPFSDKETFLGFKVQNFLSYKSHVAASSPVTAVFDDFRVNGAEGVVESEI